METSRTTIEPEPLTTTPEQQRRLDASILQEKHRTTAKLDSAGMEWRITPIDEWSDSQRDIAVDGFWHSLTADKILTYPDGAAATQEYTLPLPEFTAFVDELRQLNTLWVQGPDDGWHEVQEMTPQGLKTYRTRVTLD